MGRNIKRIGVRVIMVGILLLTNFFWDDTSAINIQKHESLTQINTDAQEFAPTFSPDGKTMIFSSTRGSTYSHLYLSRLVDGKWSSPEPLHAVNSQFNDETPFLSYDGKILLFASDRDGSVEIPRDYNGNIRVSFDIYLAKWDGKTWSAPKAVHEINSQWNEKSPSLSRDGRYLFFSTWPFGDMKRSRIRMLDLHTDGNTIEDLPPQINSGNQETAFVPGEEMNKYYFSSRRPGGKGGWDIYQTYFENGIWKNPELVPGDVNTEGNEAFLAVTNGKYYISSTFNREKKDYDLNIEPAPPSKITVQKKETPALTPNKQWKVQLIDKETNANIPGYVKLEIREKDSEKEAAYMVEQSGAKDQPIILNAPKKILRNENIRLTGKSTGYLPSTEDTDLKTLNDGTYRLALTKLKKNASISIRSIYFDFDSAQIKKSSEASLGIVLEFLEQNPNAQFEIIGHTDLNGDTNYNQELSEKRAQSVREWLIHRGINKARLSASGKGKSNPVVAKRGKPFDEQNRRTEFRLKTEL
ncbi:MAG: Protein TolB [Turneriella sp.]|nr:Protein TolB [Turneriella sp.]